MATTTAPPVLLGIDGSFAPQPAITTAFAEASRRRVGLIALQYCCDPNMPRLDDAQTAASKTVAVQTLTDRLAPWQHRYPHAATRRIIAADDVTGQLLKESESAQLVVVGRLGRISHPASGSGRWPWR